MVFSTRRWRAVSWQRRTHSTQVFPQMETGLLYRWHNWFGDTVYSSSPSVSYELHYLLMMPVLILKAVIIMLSISRFLIELWCNLSIFEGWIGLKLKITGILGCFYFDLKMVNLQSPEVSYSELVFSGGSLGPGGGTLGVPLSGVPPPATQNCLQQLQHRGGTEYALIMPQTNKQHQNHQNKQATILPRPRRPDEVTIQRSISAGSSRFASSTVLR